MLVKGTDKRAQQAEIVTMEDLVSQGHLLRSLTFTCMDLKKLATLDEEDASERLLYHIHYHFLPTSCASSERFCPKQQTTSFGLTPLLVVCLRSGPTPHCGVGFKVLLGAFG